MSPTAHVASVCFKLVRVPYRAKSPPQFLYNPHLFERHIQGVGSGPYRLDDSLAGSVCGNPCLLARRARRFCCQSRLLTGDTRRLSGVAEPLSLLSDCLERLAMMVANLTRFLGESPEPFRLIPCHLSGHAIVRKPADRQILGSVIHEITTKSVTAMRHDGMFATGHDMTGEMRSNLSRAGSRQLSRVDGARVETKAW